MTIFAMGSMVAGIACAASYEDTVLAQLRVQGYSAIKVEYTLLGRVKISAQRDGGRREIILNPRTGEVLRDLWIAAEGGAAVPSLIKEGAGGSGSGDDDAADDDDDGADSDGGTSGGSGGSGTSGGGAESDDPDDGDDGDDGEELDEE